MYVAKRAIKFLSLVYFASKSNEGLGCWCVWREWEVEALLSEGETDLSILTIIQGKESGATFMDDCGRSLTS